MSKIIEKQKPPLAKESVLAAATHQWLNVSQIMYLLDPEINALSISNEPPARQPPSGSIFLYDRMITRRYKDDGYRWIKKRNSKKVREDHVKLRLNGIKRVYGSYVHCMDNSTFHRRAYHLLEVDDAGNSTSSNTKEQTQSLVLVHYLDTQVASMKRSLNDPQHQSKMMESFLQVPQVSYMVAPMAPHHQINSFLPTAQSLGQLHDQRNNAWMNQTFLASQPLGHPQLNYGAGSNLFNFGSANQQIYASAPTFAEPVLNINNKRPFQRNQGHPLYALEQGHRAKRMATYEPGRPSLSMRLYNESFNGDKNGTLRNGHQVYDANDANDDTLSPEYFTTLYKKMKDAKDEDLKKCLENQVKIDETVKHYFPSENNGYAQDAPDYSGLTSREAMSLFLL